MIRPFDPSIDNTDELQELVLASQIYQHLDLEHQDITEDHLRELWSGAVEAHLHDRKIAYLIDVNGQINAFIRLHRNRKKNTVLIDDLYVKAEKRHHGLGSQLVNAAKEWATNVGAKKLEITLHHANEAGRHLYEKNGFKQNEPEYIDMEVSL